MQIGNINLKSDIIVAPMAGISNGAFRELCFEFGAGLVYSEMVSDKAIFYNNKKTLDMLQIDDDFHPVSLQLFGYDIETMVYAAKKIDSDTNCDIIDINMGCPVNKVIKTKAGSAMMLDEKHSVEVVKEIINNVSKPVTVKMRLGYTMDKMNYISLAKKLEEVGVKAIALHARTRSQMYEGHADWSKIKELKENLSIPVIGNGDVKSLDDYIAMKKETGVDGVDVAAGGVILVIDDTPVTEKMGHNRFAPDPFRQTHPFRHTGNGPVGVGQIIDAVNTDGYVCCIDQIMRGESD